MQKDIGIDGAEHAFNIPTVIVGIVIASFIDWGCYNHFKEDYMKKKAFFSRFFFAIFIVGFAVIAYGKEVNLDTALI